MCVWPRSAPTSTPCGRTHHGYRTTRTSPPARLASQSRPAPRGPAAARPPVRGGGRVCCCRVASSSIDKSRPQCRATRPGRIDHRIPAPHAQCLVATPRATCDAAAGPCKNDAIRYVRVGYPRCALRARRSAQRHPRRHRERSDEVTRRRCPATGRQTVRANANDLRSPLRSQRSPRKHCWCPLGRGRHPSCRP